MPKKSRNDQATNMNQVGKKNHKQIATAEELAKNYSSNATIPIDVSKFDK